jgi:hypothetical protein
VSVAALSSREPGQLPVTYDHRSVLSDLHRSTPDRDKSPPLDQYTGLTATITTIGIRRTKAAKVIKKNVIESTNMSLRAGEGNR